MSCFPASKKFFCWLFGKMAFLGHLDQYLSLLKIQKYCIVIIEKISYAISSRSCQKWQFSSSCDSWVWKSGFFRMSVSSWSQAGSLGIPIMSEGAVVGSQSALSSFRELSDKKNHHTYDKSVFGDYLLISANDPSQKCVLPLLLHILIWTSTVT